MINKSRFESEFNAISRFGALSGGGLTRLAFSSQDMQARTYLIQLLQDENFTIHIDTVGNIFARFTPIGADENLPPVSVGSHIDSVPNGGFYDGTLGVMAGLEAILTIKESGVKLARPLELIVFVCEESSRFKMATVGSKIVAGKLSQERIKELKDDDGISIFEAMQTVGFKPQNLSLAILPPNSRKAYLELHIEQGPVLENLQIPVGLVSGIAAPIRYELKILGRADHSGATPMNMRLDALVCAAHIIIAIQQSAKKFKTAVATAGYAKAVPGVLNVIPGECVLGLDIRDVSASDLAAVDKQICQKIEQICAEHGCGYELKQLTRDTPTKLDDKLINLMQEQAQILGIKTHVLPSGAGHDAMHMGGIAAQVGMIFVPCKGGISHNVRESINFADAVKGAQILARTMIELAKD